MTKVAARLTSTLLLLLLTIAPDCVVGQETIEFDWFIPQEPFATQTAAVGDTVKVVWNQGFHDVALHPSGDCTEEGSMQLAPQGASGEGTFTFEEAGTFVFACDVGGHCEAGQVVTFEVTGEGGEVVEPPVTETAEPDDEDATSGFLPVSTFLATVSSVLVSSLLLL